MTDLIQMIVENESRCLASQDVGRQVLLQKLAHDPPSAFVCILSVDCGSGIVDWGSGIGDMDEGLEILIRDCGLGILTQGLWIMDYVSGIVEYGSGILDC